MFVSDSGGSLMVKLTVTGSDGDTAVESLQIILPITAVLFSGPAFSGCLYKWYLQFYRGFRERS